jgi:hypothetical protein
MPYYEYEKSEPSQFFNKIQKNNLSKWEKIEKKRENDLQNFLKECTVNNKEILQDIKPIQHEMINKHKN